MSAQEILAWLENKPFQPFQVTLNNGERYEIRPPELALIAQTGALYVFHPASDDSAQVAGLPTSVAIRKINSVQPLPTHS